MKLNFIFVILLRADGLFTIRPCTPLSTPCQMTRPTPMQWHITHFQYQQQWSWSRQPSFEECSCSRECCTQGLHTHLSPPGSAGIHTKPGVFTKDISVSTKHHFHIWVTINRCMLMLVYHSWTAKIHVSVQRLIGCTTVRCWYCSPSSRSSCFCCLQ